MIVATLVFAAIGAFAPDAQAAETVVVDGDPYTCSFEGLRSAVADAASGDTIEFNCPGQSHQMRLTNGWITVDNKRLTIDASNGSNEQIIFYQPAEDDGDNLNQRFFTVESGGNLTIKFAELRGGSRLGDNGGAIYNAGTLFVEDCIFNGNKAQFGGAILADDGSTTTVVNSTFSANLAFFDDQDRGGNAAAIFIESTAQFEIKTSHFSDNVAENHGGAIFINNEGAATISDSTFTHNTTDFNGGAIYLDDPATLYSTRNSFVENEGADGGAIFVDEDGKLELTSDEFSTNIATGGGGAVFVNNGGAVTATDVTFNDNTAEINGGAIYVDNPSPTEPTDTPQLKSTNSSYIGNKAADGAAIFMDQYGTLEATGGLFSSNTSSSNGGAIFLHSYTDAIISSVTLETNSSIDGGGALFMNDQAHADVTNSRWENNGPAYQGAAVWVDDLASLNVWSSVFADNHANVDGGAIFVQGQLVLYPPKDPNSVANEFLRNRAPDGGAIYIDHGIIFESDGTTFEDNRATSDGGAVFVTGTAGDSSRPYSIDGATFTGNTAEDDGGALYLHRESELNISTSTFTSNESVPRTENGQQVSGDGGAIHNLGNLEISDSVFTENRSSLNDAGAIYNDESLSVSGSTFSNNWTARSGGAIVSLTDSNLRVESSVFNGNHAEMAGGAIYTSRDTLTQIDSSTFQDNSARWTGGAIHSQFGSTTIHRSSFVENHSGQSGGALYNVGAMEIAASTLSLNTSDQPGSAISGCECDGDQQTIIRWSTVVHADQPAVEIFFPTTLEGVIVTGPGDACFFRASGSLLTSSNSVADDDSCGLESGRSPLPIVGLRTTIDQSGVTQTYHPVIQNGPADSAGGSVCAGDMDQLGATRPLGSACEIGAVEEHFVEYNPLLLCANEWNGQLRVTDRSRSCGRGEISVQIPSVEFLPTFLCVNDWNGAVRLDRNPDSCGRSEHQVAVDGFGDVPFCVNKWNGTMRASDSCSRSEYAVML